LKVILQSFDLCDDLVSIESFYRLGSEPGGFIAFVPGLAGCAYRVLF